MREVINFTLFVWREIEVDTGTVFKVSDMEFDLCAVTAAFFTNISFFHCDQHLIVDAEN